MNPPWLDSSDLGQEDLRAVLDRDVVAGARRLLGCTLIYAGGRARIVETEAYRGSDDPGCHAFGRTQMKNMSLFGLPGRAYIYRSYGIHQMLNVVALPEGIAAGILIRALRPIDAGGEVTRSPVRPDFQGPGRLAKSLGLDATYNGMDLLVENERLQIQPAPPIDEILVGPRIGLAVGKGETIPWRFISATDLPWASASRKGLSPLLDPESSSLLP